MAENDLLKRLLDAGMTFTALTQSRAEELIRDLVRVGAVQAEQAQASVDELIDRSRRNSERLVDAVRTEIDQQLAKLDLATRDDLDRVVQRFTEVANSLLDQAMPGRADDTSSSTASTRGAAPATLSTAERAASAGRDGSTRAGAAAGKKSAAKKTTAKKSAAKKTTAAKKSTSKKSAAKKGAGKKSAAKKSPAKKSAAKQAATKAPAGKKSAARKSSS